MAPQTRGSATTVGRVRRQPVPPEEDPLSPGNPRGRRLVDEGRNSRVRVDTVDEDGNSLASEGPEINGSLSDLDEDLDEPEPLTEDEAEGRRYGENDFSDLIELTTEHCGCLTNITDLNGNTRVCVGLGLYLATTYYT